MDTTLSYRMKMASSYRQPEADLSNGVIRHRAMSIGVLATFLANLAQVLKLDAADRRHLFLLAHERPPAEPGKTWCVLPPLVRRLMHDLPHPAFVLNLR